MAASPNGRISCRIQWLVAAKQCRTNQKCLHASLATPMDWYPRTRPAVSLSTNSSHDALQAIYKSDLPSYHCEFCAANSQPLIPHFLLVADVKLCVMHFLIATCLLEALFSLRSLAYPVLNSTACSEEDIQNGRCLAQIQKLSNDLWFKSAKEPASCNLRTVSVRKEW